VVQEIQTEKTVQGLSILISEPYGVKWVEGRGLNQKGSRSLLPLVFFVFRRAGGFVDLITNLCLLKMYCCAHLGACFQGKLNPVN
jgi:hypothetical protein